MAVVPMQKVRLFVHHEEVDTALAVLQQHGAVAFSETTIEGAAAFETDFPQHDLLPRVDHAVWFLELYAQKASLLKKLRQGSFYELHEADALKLGGDPDVIESIVSDVEAVQVAFADANELVRQLEDRRKALLRFKQLPVRLAALATKTSRALLLEAKDTKTPLGQRLQKALAQTEIPFEVLSLSNTEVVLIVETASISSTELETILSAAAAVVVSAPEGTETPEIELTKVEEALAAARGEVARLHDMAEHVSHTHLRQLKIASEVLGWKRDRFALTGKAVSTKSVTVLDGWLRTDLKQAVETNLKTATPTAFFTELELADGEEPPVEIKNSVWLEPFEAVTRLYGMPGYKDLDPTAFLAAFFFLFFGLSLTDVGYGAALMVVAAGLLLFAKLNKTLQSFMKLLLYVGFATVIVGALFGGYFGIAPDVLPEPLQKLQKFDPIGDPLPVFYLALSLGVFQVVVGLLLKIYSESRQGRLSGALMSEGPWLFLFALGILYVLQMVNWVPNIISNDRITVLAYIGIGALVVLAARSATGVLDAIMKAGGALYGSVGFLSDILSYSRLLALGLATTALAFAVNLIADIVRESAPIIGPVLALVVLVIGHVFTLAVNTLGAFIHSARLQFVEFFGKFIAGTGQEFKPLARSQRYVTIVKE